MSYPVEILHHRSIRITLLGLLFIFLLSLVPYSARALTTGQAAGVVLGQTAFTSNGVSPSSTTLDVPSAVAFDSQGNLWIADSSNNRVLEYVAPFTTGEAASVVLGQAGFDSENCNGPSSIPSKTTLCAPSAVAFDSHGNLWVTDEANNRVLEFVKGSGFTTGQAAGLVLGEPSFAPRGCNASSAVGSTTLCYPDGIAFDSQGNLWVADGGNNRVLEFSGGSGFTTDEAATLVIGQASFSSNSSSTSSTTLNLPYGIAFDSHGNLWVADQVNSRVVEYLKGSGFTTGQVASLVIGQTGSASGDCDGPLGRASSTTLCYPYGIAFDSSGNLWVSDSSDRRILEFSDGSGFTTGQAASLVLGEPGYSTVSVCKISTVLCVPYGIAFDSHGNLWVADQFYNRVIEYLKGSGYITGETPSLAIGQSSLTSVQLATSTNLNLPTAEAFDSSGNLWVADSHNNRVVEYKAPFTIGEAASVVIGQANSTSGDCDNSPYSFANSTAISSVTGSVLCQPNGIAFDSQGNLWVADAGNNRVLEYLRGSGFTNGQTASLVIGQTGLASRSCDDDRSVPSSGTLCGPAALAFDSSGNLWVADSHNNRVLEFLKGSGFTTGQGASLVIGQTGLDSDACVQFSPAAASLCGPSALAFGSSGNLWVADSGNSRVLEYVRASGFSTGEAASLVLGEPNLTSDDCHGVPTGLASSTALCYPSGITIDSSGNLWVADLANNRVLEYPDGSGFSTGQAASLVIGQTGFKSSDCDDGSVALIPSSSTLCGPSALAFDSQGNLWVADTANNRVLGYNNRVTEPITVTFDKVNGGSPQTVTVSGCSPASPALSGNGTSSDIVLSGGCSFTLNLPPGYQWETSNSSTSCGSGTCTAFTAAYEAIPPSTVVQPISATFDPTRGGSAQTVTVSGCSPAPSTLQGDGSLNKITMASSCTFSLTLPPGYQWEGDSGAASCSTGICTVFGAKYEVAPLTQPIKATFDSAYGGHQQTVMIMGCAPSPIAFAGDGASHNISLSAMCEFTLGLPTGYEFTSGGNGTSCTSGTCDGVTASYQQKPTSQPIAASLDPGNGGIPQTVTVTGFCAQTPGTLTGNGTAQEIMMIPSCSFSLTLPPGYQWEGTSSGISCSSGPCSAFDATYEADTPASVTQPIRVSFDGSNGGVEQTITITGCNSVPSIFSGVGIANEFIMSPSCSYTLTLPPGYQWTTGSDSITCSSGTCSDFSASYEATIPVHVPEFPSGSSLFAAAIGIFVLAVLSRARNLRTSAHSYPSSQKSSNVKAQGDLI